MTDYTPTTDEVMTAVVTYRAIWGPGVQPPATRAVATAEETAQYVEEWNRWLAQVKAEAQVEVLTDVAGSFFARTHDGMPNGRAHNSYSVARIVREVADRIARGAGIETGEKNDG